MPKEILLDTEARAKLVKGIDTVANAVKTTLGPKGRNVALGKKYSGPTVTHDGVTVAKDIDLEDNFVEMGQFTDAGSFDTSWHRICTKEVQVLGSWAFTPDEVAQAMRDLHAIQSIHDWPRLHTNFALSEEGVVDALTAATQMTALKATVVPRMGNSD